MTMTTGWLRAVGAVGAICVVGCGGGDGVDGGGADAGQDAATFDASRDAGRDSGDVPRVPGAPCTTGADCHSGLCAEVEPGRSVCTARCGVDGDCIPGWTCGVVGEGEFATDACVCAPSTETCNMLDDDCDGVVDDGVAGCCTAGETRACGTSAGPCEAGSETCLGDGTWGECVGRVIPEPEPELCDGVDNDCNPATPDGEDEPDLGAPCDGTDTDLCEEAVTTCVDGALVCDDSTDDVIELCNGIDDDCDPSTADGSADPDLGAACDGADTDLCAEGVLACVDGAPVCDDTTGDSVETCDLTDEDCDGTVDEGLAGCCAHSTGGTCSSTPVVMTLTCTAADLADPGLPSRVVFSSTGADQPFVVPAGVTTIHVELWGAAGGTWGSMDGDGGGGAFALARLLVTAGESLTVMVGSGGGDGFSRALIYGGGGHGGFFGGNAGGRSAILRGTTELVTAAGGGGGGSCNGGVCGPGGAGGVNAGEDGTDSDTVDATWGTHGTGATHMCGGDGGITTCGCGASSGDGEGGRAFLGGSTIGSAPGQGAGGGGGGWYGGGSGGGDCGGNTGGGGGGGSSHVVPSEGCAMAGSGATPGNDADSDRTGLVGTGGSGGSDGGPGLVVIRY